MPTCVGNNPGSCGINMEGAGKCSNSSKACWFDTDCSPGEQCTDHANGHQHINQTCSQLLKQFQDKVICNDGYEAAVSTDPNYDGHVNKRQNQRQPCVFVCNKSSAPGPSPPGPSPSKGMSTGVKIGIGVGVAIIIVLLVLALMK